MSNSNSQPHHTSLDENGPTSNNHSNNASATTGLLGRLESALHLSLPSPHHHHNHHSQQQSYGTSASQLLAAPQPSTPFLQLMASNSPTTASATQSLPSLHYHPPTQQHFHNSYAPTSYSQPPQQQQQYSPTSRISIQPGAATATTTAMPTPPVPPVSSLQVPPPMYSLPQPAPTTSHHHHHHHAQQQQTQPQHQQQEPVFKQAARLLLNLSVEEALKNKESLIMLFRREIDALEKLGEPTSPHPSDSISPHNFAPKIVVEKSLKKSSAKVIINQNSPLVSPATSPLRMGGNSSPLLHHHHGGSSSNGSNKLSASTSSFSEWNLDDNENNNNNNHNSTSKGGYNMPGNALAGMQNTKIEITSSEYPEPRPYILIRGARSREYERFEKLEQVNCLPYKYCFKIVLPLEYQTAEGTVIKVKKRTSLNYRLDHEDIRIAVVYPGSGDPGANDRYEIPQGVNIEKHIGTHIYDDRKEIEFRLSFHVYSYHHNNKGFVVEIIDKEEGKVLMTTQPVMIRARRKKGTKRSQEGGSEKKEKKKQKVASSASSSTTTPPPSLQLQGPISPDEIPSFAVTPDE